MMPTSDYKTWRTTMANFFEQNKASLTDFVTDLKNLHEKHHILVPDYLMGELEFVIDEATAELEALKERGK